MTPTLRSERRLPSDREFAVSSRSALKPRLSLIAAVAENGVIGVNNKLPWKLPADLRHFRALTIGHHVLMGRKTCESLPGPLPERINIVLTSNAERSIRGFVVVDSIAASLALAGDDELFVIGGASVYRQTLAHVQRMYLTLVHAHVEGDTQFPEFDRSVWQELTREKHVPDANHRYGFSFVMLERRT
jgi:dihydrofolate reductase